MVTLLLEAKADVENMVHPDQWDKLSVACQQSMDRDKCVQTLQRAFQESSLNTSASAPAEGNDPFSAGGADDDPFSTGGAEDDPFNAGGAEDDPFSTGGAEDDMFNMGGAEDVQFSTGGAEDDADDATGGIDEDATGEDVTPQQVCDGVINDAGGYDKYDVIARGVTSTVSIYIPLHIS